MPVFTFNTISGNVASVALDKMYIDMINKEKKKGLEIIQCKINYIVEVVDKDTKSKQYEIVYENGKLYLVY